MFHQRPLLWVQERALAISAIALFVIYLMWVVLRPAGIFWSTDEAGKFIYLESVLRGAGPGGPLIYPARAFDPNLNFVPLYYFVPQGDQIYSWWPVGFPLLSLPFYRLLGWIGLFVLPALGGAWSAYVTGLITRHLYPKNDSLAVLAVWITGLATPVAFYSAMFWEHTLALAALLSSFFLVLKFGPAGKLKTIFLAGGLASLAVFLRTEIAAYLIGIGLVLLFINWVKALAYTAGFGLIAVVWMAVDQITMGNLISRQWNAIAGAQSAAGISQIGLKFFPFLLFNFPFPVSYEFSRPLLAAASLLALLAVAACFWRRVQWVAAVSALGLTAICGWVLISPVGYTFLSGFLLVAPFLVFAAWFFAQKSVWKESLAPALILAAGGSFGLVFAIRAWSNAGGLQWGPRYLLPYYPLLVVAALIGLVEVLQRSKKWLRRILVAACVLGILIGAGFELRGQYVVWVNAAYASQSEKALANVKQQPIIVDCSYVPMLISNLYWRGDILFVPASKTADWESNVRQLGLASYGKINSDLCQWINLSQLGDLRRGNPSGITIDTNTVAP